MIDYSKYEKSLKHLELQFNNYNQSQDRSNLTALDREAIAESVIQRFETCFDCLWKVLKRYLTEEIGVADMPNSAKPIFRIAFENKLFVADITQWIQYVDARIDTSHDYSENKVYAVLGLMKDFIADATDLYITMTGKTWE
ncbi:MAG: nucleotidyltransferase [Sphingobacteriaceae bacterium]|nr:MAG: nucleotidyltransferase [Sphingobacteriaceae bacterium]